MPYFSFCFFPQGKVTPRNIFVSKEWFGNFSQGMCVCVCVYIYIYIYIYKISEGKRTDFYSFILLKSIKG